MSLLSSHGRVHIYICVYVQEVRPLDLTGFLVPGEGATHMGASGQGESGPHRPKSLPGYPSGQIPMPTLEPASLPTQDSEHSEVNLISRKKQLYLESKTNTLKAVLLT